MTGADLKAGILIVSDTASRDPSSDAADETLRSTFDNEGGDQWTVVGSKIIPDDVLAIQRAITGWTDVEAPLHLIVTTGGTGFAVKDNTPEAVSNLIHKHAPGLVHGMLATSMTVTPFALMSRPVAGVRNETLIITLPGSPKGAKENLQAILKLLPHACVQAAGADSRALHVGGVRRLEKEAGVSIGSPSHAGEPVNQDQGAHQRHHHHHHHHQLEDGRSAFHGSHTAPVSHTRPDAHHRSNDPNEGPSRRNRSSPYPMLSVEEALGSISSKMPGRYSCISQVDGSLVGSVLAEDVRTDESVPAFRASIVDGYALIAPSDGPSVKGVLPVVSISHAAPGDIKPLKPGEIARITTGAPLPPGATAVVMVEDTVLKTKSDDGKEEKEVEILTDKVKAGENVREIGSDIKAGDTILREGEEITAIGGELGLLVSVGKTEVSVYRRPIVGVLSTGDEIVPHTRPGKLRLGEVRDCNRPTLMAAVRGAGFEAQDLGIAGDRPGALEESLRDALRKVDVIVTSGGVSMGELDLLKPTIERSLGGTIHFGRVAMKPGKPTTFATIPFKNAAGDRETKGIFSLPGNPASAVVTFHLFVLPSLHQASGIKPAGLPKMTVILGQDIRPDPVRPEYHRVRVSAGKDGLLHAVSTGGQRSSRIGSLKSANALLCLSPGNKILPRGDRVEALLMGKLLGQEQDRLV
ncbi:MAG: hypothetical protein M1837_007459 [Sclerophora amabilis]|nr:MAG: hypothetical protein M1837_007459 [Sclerophora amabilis]